MGACTKRSARSSGRCDLPASDLLVPPLAARRRPARPAAWQRCCALPSVHLTIAERWHPPLLRPSGGLRAAVGCSAGGLQVGWGGTAVPTQGVTVPTQGVAVVKTPQAWHSNFTTGRGNTQGCGHGGPVLRHPEPHGRRARPRPGLQAVGLSRAARAPRRPGEEGCLVACAGASSRPPRSRLRPGPRLAAGSRVSVARPHSPQMLPCIAPGPDEIVLCKTSSSVFQVGVWGLGASSGAAPS